MSEDVREKLRKLAALDGTAAESNWLGYLAGEGEERQQADELLDVLLHKQAGKTFRKAIFLEPPSAMECEGSYVLGDVVYPPGQLYARFGLREDEWIKHLLIVGMTGAGKTNLAFQILMQFRERGKPFLVFDWKRNYRDLLQLPGLENLKIYTVGRSVKPFQFNPLLPPPGTLPGEWLMKLVDVLKHAYFVGEGVEYLLRQGIDWVYEKTGFLEGQPARAPTFAMVRDFISKMQLHGRMSLWKASARRVLESLCFRHGLGPVLNTDLETDFKTLLEQNVILELDALSDSDKVFVTEAMILWVYEYRKNCGSRERFKHAILIEEAHHVLSQAKEQAEGRETIMETCLRQIREFGEAVIAIDQEPTKLSNSIKANTYAKLCFALGNGKDVQEIARSMGLDEEEASYLDLLPVGQAVMKLKGRSHKPILLRVPHIKLHKGWVKDSGLASYA